MKQIQQLNYSPQLPCWYMMCFTSRVQRTLNVFLQGDPG